MGFKAAVLGLGNIGRFAVEALEVAPDFECVGVVRRRESLGKAPHDLRGVPEFASMDELVEKAGKPDAVLICSPSRQVPDNASALLEKGFNTVDSFDIHDRILETVDRLDAAARAGQAVSITAAGWDPGHGLDAARPV